jgi:hypothetical protein
MGQCLKVLSLTTSFLVPRREAAAGGILWSIIRYEGTLISVCSSDRICAPGVSAGLAAASR